MTFLYSFWNQHLSLSTYRLSYQDLNTLTAFYEPLETNDLLISISTLHGYTKKKRNFGKWLFPLVVPSISIRTKNPISWILGSKQKVIKTPEVHRRWLFLTCPICIQRRSIQRIGRRYLSYPPTWVSIDWRHRWGPTVSENKRKLRDRWSIFNYGNQCRWFYLAEHRVLRRIVDPGIASESLVAERLSRASTSMISDNVTNALGHFW